MPAYNLMNTPGTSMDDLSPKTTQILHEVEQQYRLNQMLNGADGLRQMSGSTPNLAGLGLSVPKDPFASQNCKAFDDVQRQRSTLEKIRRQKQGALQELKSIQKVLERNRSDIRQTERQLEETKAKTEDARTELVLLEFKRDAAVKDMEHLASEFRAKQLKFREESHQKDEAAVKTEELTALMKENSLLKERLLERDMGNQERQEMERQVNRTKEELFSEQKKFRGKVDSLQEELDQKTQQLEEALSAKDELCKNHTKTEAKYRMMEQEKNTIIQEKTREFEDTRKSLEQQMSQLRATKDQELHDLETQVKVTMEQLTKLDADIKLKDEHQCKLKEQILHLEAELTKEKACRETVVKKQQENIETVRSEKNEALKSLRVSLEEDKCAALETLRRCLEAKHEKLLQQAEQTLLNQVQELQASLTATDMELEVSKERLRQQEALVMTMSTSFRQEAQDQARALLESERNRWSQEKSDEIERRTADYRNDVESTISRLQEELSVSRSTLDKQGREIIALKEELEGQRHSNQAIYRDKLVALNQIKEAAEQEKEKEMEQFKAKLEKDTFKQMDRLRETVKKQEEEINSLRGEKQEISAREREMIASTEKHERAIITDLNELCKRLADIVGGSPRKVNLPGFSTLWTATKMPFGSPQNVTHQVLQTALKNFRESTGDISKCIEDLKHDLERHKQALLRQEQLKSEELEGLRMKFQNDKAVAIEELKARLIQDHIDEVDRLHKALGKGNSLHKTLWDKDVELREIQRNMNKWREDTAEKLARKFQGEMNKELDKRVKDFEHYQREWEHEKSSQQRELERLERELSIRNAVSSGSILKYYKSTPGDTIQLPTNQHSVSNCTTPTKHKLAWQPSTPTLAANRKLSNSVSDLPTLNNLSGKQSPSSLDTSLNSLKQRNQAAEWRALAAEERANSAQNALNLKMRDYTRLQGDMSHQTKEYLQLERAYSKLQNQTIQPAKPLKSCLR